VRTWTARSCAELQPIGEVLHDAQYELGSAVFDAEQGELRLVFGQRVDWGDFAEDAVWAALQPASASRTWLGRRRTSVPLARGTLLVRRVAAADLREDMDWASQFEGLVCEDDGRSLRLSGVSGDYILTVDAIDVTATLEPVEQGRLLVTTWWLLGVESERRA
jgi:hypothetical protein